MIPYTEVRKMSVRRIKNPQVMHPLVDTDLINIEMEWDDSARCWTTSVPVFGISDYGDTYEEALDHTAEAILLYLDSAERHGDHIPISRRKVWQLRDLLEK